jgi:hypothetical protein
MQKIEFCWSSLLHLLLLLAQPTAAIRRCATLFLQSFPGGCDGVGMERAERQRFEKSTSETLSKPYSFGSRADKTAPGDRQLILGSRDASFDSLIRSFPVTNRRVASLSLGNSALLASALVPFRDLHVSRHFPSLVDLALAVDSKFRSPLSLQCPGPSRLVRDPDPNGISRLACAIAATSVCKRILTWPGPDGQR